MSIIYLIKIILSKLKYVVLIALSLAIGTYYTVKDNPRTYLSSASLYTGVNSGFTLEGVSTLNQRQASTTYDHIIQILESPKTHKMVGGYLLAQHLKMGDYDNSVLSEDHIDMLVSELPYNYADVFDLDKDVAGLAQELFLYQEKKDGAWLSDILLSEYYNFKNIKDNLKVVRIDYSDFVKLEYSSSDAGVSKFALEYLIEVFRLKFQDLKYKEVNDAVLYYEKEMLAMKQNFVNAEDKLSVYKEQNGIIDFKSQTINIASQKELMENYYIRTKMDLKASGYQLKELEKSMVSSQDIIINTTRIIDSNSELSKLYSDIEKAKMLNQSAIKIEELEVEAAVMSVGLAETVNELFVTQHGKNGVSTDEVQSNWLSTKMKIKEYEGKIDGIEFARTHYDKKYNQFAKVGADLEKLNREKVRFEEEYQSLYKSFSDAKKYERNIRMAFAFSVIDPPLYPLKAEPSKTVRSVLMAGMAGLIMSIFMVIFLELLDSGIKTVEKITKLSGFKVEGVFAYEEGSDSKGVDVASLIKISIGRLMQAFRSYDIVTSSNYSKNIEISVVSMRPKEGKTYLIKNFVTQAASLGKKIAVVTPDLYYPVKGVDVYNYSTANDFVTSGSVDEVVNNKNYKKENYDYTIFEYPSLVQNQVPIKCLMNSDRVMLVVDASRSWDDSDSMAIDSLKDIVDGKTVIALNGMNLMNMEYLIGEIPRKRSMLRKFIKEVFKVQLNKHSYVRRNNMGSSFVYQTKNLKKVSSYKN